MTDREQHCSRESAEFRFRNWVRRLGLGQPFETGCGRSGASRSGAVSTLSFAGGCVQGSTGFFTGLLDWVTRGTIAVNERGRQRPGGFCAPACEGTRDCAETGRKKERRRRNQKASEGKSFGVGSSTLAPTDAVIDTRVEMARVARSRRDLSRHRGHAPRRGRRCDGLKIFR